MTETYFPFDPQAMDEGQWAKMARFFMGTGVAPEDLRSGVVGELEVSHADEAGMHVTIDTGVAFIKGVYYENEDVIDPFNTLTKPPTNYDRIDILVLKCKWGESSGVTHGWAQGEQAPTGTAEPPDISAHQVVGVEWWLPLAEVLIHGNDTDIEMDQITDRRNFAGNEVAKGVTLVVAAADASARVRMNADFVIPAGYTSGTYFPYPDADQIIMDAIDALPPTTSGTIMLTEGAFWLSDTVDLVGNLTLAGFGLSTALHADSGFTAAQPMLYGNGTNNVTIRDLVMNGHQTSAVAGQHGIMFRDAEYCRVKGCNVHNFKDIGIFVDATSEYASQFLKIIDNVSAGNAGFGIAFAGSRSVIALNEVASNGTSGIFFTGGSSLDVKNNQVHYNGARGIHFTGADRNVSRSTISGNTVYENSQTLSGSYDGIWLEAGAYGCQRVSVLNNHVWSYDAPAVIHRYGICVNTSVLNCTVTFNDVTYSTTVVASRAKDLGTGTNMEHNAGADI